MVNRNYNFRLDKESKVVKRRLKTFQVKNVWIIENDEIRNSLINIFIFLKIFALLKKN